jgi:hypothetical protein
MNGVMEFCALCVLLIMGLIVPDRDFYPLYDSMIYNSLISKYC